MVVDRCPSSRFFRSATLMSFPSTPKLFHVEATPTCFDVSDHGTWAVGIDAASSKTGDTLVVGAGSQQYYMPNFGPVHALSWTESLVTATAGPSEVLVEDDESRLSEEPSSGADANRNGPSSIESHSFVADLATIGEQSLQLTRFETGDAAGGCRANTILCVDVPRRRPTHVMASTGMDYASCPTLTAAWRDGTAARLDVVTQQWHDEPRSINGMRHSPPMAALTSARLWDDRAVTVCAFHNIVVVLDERTAPKPGQFQSVALEWSWDACDPITSVEASSVGPSVPWLLVGTQLGAVAMFDVRRPGAVCTATPRTTLRSDTAGTGLWTASSVHAIARVASTGGAMSTSLVQTTTGEVHFVEGNKEGNGELSSQIVKTAADCPRWAGVAASAAAGLAYASGVAQLWTLNTCGDLTCYDW